MTDEAPKPQELTLLQTKRIELTASYLNIIASGIFTIGSIAPTAAYLIGATSDDAQIFRLALSVVCFTTVSLVFHFLARFVLGRIEP